MREPDFRIAVSHRGDVNAQAVNADVRKFRDGEGRQGESVYFEYVRGISGDWVIITGWYYPKFDAELELNDARFVS